nr:MAG TPA: hypothetical protein [Bacteriophage sp.]
MENRVIYFNERPPFCFKAAHIQQIKVTDLTILLRASCSEP